MKWPKWRIDSGPGDFLPMLIGCVFLFISGPSFLMLLLIPDRNSGLIGGPLLTILGTGIVLGVGFIILGVRLLSRPGSLAYRIAHFRFFWR